MKNSVVRPKAPSPLITSAFSCTMLVSWSDAQKPSHLFPHPSASAVSAGIFGSLAGPSTRAASLWLTLGTWGSTRLRDPPLARPRPRPAAASPSALIKTCEMERLARAAPFYLQHLSCC